MWLHLAPSAPSLCIRDLGTSLALPKSNASAIQERHPRLSLFLLVRTSRRKNKGRSSGLVMLEGPVHRGHGFRRGDFAMGRASLFCALCLAVLFLPAMGLAGNRYGLPAEADDGRCEGLARVWFDEVLRPALPSFSDGSTWDEWGRRVGGPGQVRATGGIDGFSNPWQRWLEQSASCRAWVRRRLAEGRGETGSAPSAPEKTGADGDGTSLTTAGRDSDGQEEGTADPVDDAEEDAAEDGDDDSADEASESAESSEASASHASPASVDAIASLSEDDASTFRLAVLADLHVGKKGNLPMLGKLVEALNGDGKISAVAILGDLCERVGTRKELERVVALVRRIEHPTLIVSGNHDYRNSDRLRAGGKTKRGSTAEQKKKLERFRKALSITEPRRSMVVAGHHLVFLPTDALKASQLVSVSSGTLKWFRGVLEKHRTLPTVCFAHAPLAGSFQPKGDQLPVRHASLQPAKEIAAILGDNPQVRLWVAGHRHSGIRSKYGKVKGVEGLPVPTVHKGDAFIRYLEFSPGKIRLRSYDVAKKRMVKSCDRLIAR